jgi:hypothetical protein
MAAHSVIAYRTGTAGTIGFDPERCSQYVPLRLPSTLCVQERLPPGAAAVLLNRSHPYHDLILMEWPDGTITAYAADIERR